MVSTTKICQMTGGADRGSPGTPTGPQRTGVTGGVTGTDLGFSFEYNGALRFLFGDSREFHPDLCEPYLCGTQAAPIPLTQPNPENVQLWRSQQEWDLFVDARGDGYDSMATAPLDFDPDLGIPITFETNDIGLVFAHAIAETEIGNPTQFFGARVASNPGDKWTLVMGNRILVITQTGSVFVHEITGTAIGAPFQLAGPAVAANPQDKRVLVMGNRILVVTTSGDVFFHEINGDTIGVPFQLSGPPVAANPQDKWVLVMGTRILVITDDGRVFAHELTSTSIGVPFQLGGPRVAANPQDHWAIALGNRIVVITRVGGVFAHETTATDVNPATQLSGPRVASNPRDRQVLAMGSSLLILTLADGTFRPSRLNGQPLGRKEGVFSAFTDGNAIYAIFTLRNKLPGCSNSLGCAHDDDEPGGVAVLGKSVGDTGDFAEVSVLSCTKFLWAVPEIVATASLPGLPEGLGDSTVMLFGAGRTNNDRGGENAAKWNHSYPFLAVAPLAAVGEPDGKVFAHPINGTSVGSAQQLGGPKVAGNPQDKWVLAMGNRILVITAFGDMFAHEINGDTIGVPVQLSGPQVAGNPQDKWVLVMGNRILVITDNGSVFAHDISSTAIGVPVQLSGPSVAANPQDKWVVTANDTILVITASGGVFVHQVSGNTISAAFQLSGPPVAANPEDKWVLATLRAILVITTDGRVFVHSLGSTSVSPATQMTGPPVASNLQDKRVLLMGSGTVRIFVITRQPWRFFAGVNAAGSPLWSNGEAAAQPLLPFGSPEFGIGFHQSFGYFSARFIAPWRKWAMLYTCNDDASAGYNPANGPRGVYFRAADLPWGPWSAPKRIFDPGTGYCSFMHNQDADTGSQCSGKGLNPLEESVRDYDTVRRGPNKRAWGGEYAPLLLPSRYAKVGTASVTLYFLLSTWNPYQAVLMRTVISN